MSINSKKKWEDRKWNEVTTNKIPQEIEEKIIKFYVITDANGKCFACYTLKEAEECIKECNLNKMPKLDTIINGVRYYVGINQEDSSIQRCYLRGIK